MARREFGNWNERATLFSNRARSIRSRDHKRRSATRMKKTDVQFLTLTLVTLCIVAAVASAAELKTPAGRTVWLRDNRGVSLFFDTTLTGWTADELVASLRGIRPEMFVVEAQLIHGAQYPTACKRGAALGRTKTIWPGHGKWHAAWTPSGLPTSLSIAPTNWNTSPSKEALP